MGFQLTERVIKLLCGQTSYDKGEDYVRAGKVSFTQYDADPSLFKAAVEGSRSYQVIVEIDRNGDVYAECTCPAYLGNGNNCKHIAAVLLSIHHTEQGGSGQAPIRAVSSLLDPETQGRNDPGYIEPRVAQMNRASRQASADHRLTDSMLGLFGNQPKRTTSSRALFDTRTQLTVEFTLKPFPYSYRKSMFGIEMKLGTKRLYIVQKLRDFLEKLERKEAFVFSKHFIYDPLLHSLQKEDDAILQQLIQIYDNEQMYKETISHYPSHSSTAGGERLLLIPAFSWEALFPLLEAAPLIKLEQGRRIFEGLQLSDEPLPLRFEFDQAEQLERGLADTDPVGYQLDIQGLDEITVMESYGMVLYDGKFLKLQPEQGKQLSEMKQMLEVSRKQQIQIAPVQMEAFMDKVIPGLMKMGSVRIAKAVSERIVHTPLIAKLYLDRVKDRLLAGLEFQYGDIIVNPLEGSLQKRGTDRILMRDGEQEARILALMEHSSVVQTESGYFIDNEEAEYEFLYHTVPQLEKLLDVYATSAVKVRLHTGPIHPKVAVELNERTDWLEFRFDMEGIPEAEIRHLLKSLEAKRKYYRLPNGSLLPLEGDEFQEIMQFMNESGIRDMEVKGTGGQLPVLHALHLMDSQQQGHAVKLGKSFRRLLENIRNPDNLDFPVPIGLSTVLRDYQIYGFQWMKTLAHYHFGGILADDMGLGKTLQSIAFLVSVLPEIRQLTLPAIIVCPASLVYNWRNELQKFAPEIKAVIADGIKTERDLVLTHVFQVDVIITSYPLLRRDIKQYAKQSFHTLILDEAQMFKNHTTQTAQSVKQIQAQYRFALTGTPVENRIEELWSIFNVVFPALFPVRKVFSELSRENVAKRIRPFLLRRLKTDVLKELPDKIESLQASELLPEQKKLYVAYLAQLQQETLKHLSEDGFQKHRIKILAGLTRLRQLCCHPALFVEGYSGSSAKFEQLLEIIEECRSAGKRMLIFSQFTKMLELIGRELGYQGVPYFYLDGSTPASQRVELCNRFNKGEHELFLISLKAGGTGLNLTGADTVILYDLWWNPAVEQQAADRAHRIGQKNVVQVIRLVTQGTVEDKMYELQQKKKSLIDEVIQPGQEALSTLSEQEIRDILMIH
ncbi:DEAD/DEAH box helicase [Paenibacillus agricola]|uniref:Helicase SNF n=1 Tax=Paenibacillus agricola TaxID=2716264 RepID=A0ABX0J552_9BACL|nr:DEAD/DEAH box helicase [Paenibacillus agricola]NHN30541.1 helicase SNF [Paenibacillus agricola]